GVPAFALYEDDRLELYRNGLKKIPGKKIYPTLQERAAELHSASLNYAGRFPAVNDLGALWDDARRAALHMFSYMDKYGWTSEWIFEIRLNDDSDPWHVDLHKRTVCQSEAPAGPKRLTCFTDASYFAALIHRL